LTPIKQRSLAATIHTRFQENATPGSWRRPRRPSQAAGLILAKSLDDAALPDSAIREQKNPFVFKDRLFDFANFSKFIFGRNAGNQCVAPQKIWIHRFWILRVALWLGLHGLAVIEKHPITIPYFPKQLVAVLVAARSLRASAAKPADRSTIISQIESRSPGPGISLGLVAGVGEGLSGEKRSDTRGI
jgi:hypothetical protein